MNIINKDTPHYLKIEWYWRKQIKLFYRFTGHISRVKINYERISLNYVNNTLMVIINEFHLLSYILEF